MISVPPKFLAAIRGNSPVHYFCDIWPRVLADQSDSMLDFQAGSSPVNMDFTTSPGFAQLSVTPGMFGISQTADNAGLQVQNNPLRGATSLSVYLRASFQKIYLDSVRSPDAVTVKIDNSGGGDGYFMVQLVSGLTLGGVYQEPLYTIRSTGYVAMAGGFSGTKVISLSPGLLEPGYYWLIGWSDNASCQIRYQNTDVYTPGQLDYCYRPAGSPYYAWTYNIGDAYFVLSMSGYAAAGSFTTEKLSVGTKPPENGVFQITASVPASGALAINLKGSDTGVFGGEETIYPNIQDGAEIANLIYWRADCGLTSGPPYTDTPKIDTIGVLFPVDRFKVRPRGVALPNVDKSLLDWRPMLQPVSWSPSELMPRERTSTLGSMSITLAHSQPAELQRLVSDSTLKNCRAFVYAGCDVPGFSEKDLFRCFMGIIKAGDITPQFFRDTYEIPLTIENPVLELKKKVPLADVTGIVDFTNVAIDWEKVHAVDAMVDLIRSRAATPGRYIDIGSFFSTKPLIGYGGLSSSVFIVRRSDAAGLADTRITKPEEAVKVLAPLLTIVDGYQVIKADCRIAFVLHTTTLPSGAPVWADYRLIQNGLLDAIPVTDISKIELGYDDLLYNACYGACNWNGSGTDWGKDFNGTTYCHIDADSAELYGQGSGYYIKMYETNMLDVAKMLGPELGYNGQTISMALTKLIVDRFKYPPVRIKGAVLPISQFTMGAGDIVSFSSPEFAKWKRRGIALSETLPFMITRSQHDKGRNRMVFDLMELT
jgi:hypothetical protein